MNYSTSYIWARYVSVKYIISQLFPRQCLFEVQTTKQNRNMIIGLFPTSRISAKENIDSKTAARYECIAFIKIHMP